MNKPSSTIQAASAAGFVTASLLLAIKIFWPAIYVQIPPDYQGYLIVAVTMVIGYFKKENVLPLDRM